MPAPDEIDPIDEVERAANQRIFDLLNKSIAPAKPDWNSQSALSMKDIQAAIDDCRKRAGTIVLSEDEPLSPEAERTLSARANLVRSPYLDRGQAYILPPDVL